MKLKDEFIFKNNQQFRFKLGTLIASSLSGFIAGALVASIVWLLFIIAEKI